MNTNFKSDEVLDLNSIFEFKSDKAEIEHEARMIMYRFLSEIERTSDQKRGLKKKLSKSIQKSQSFITQLFNGDKIVNLITLAKLQKALSIKFKITAYPQSEFDYYSNSTQYEMTKNIFLLNSLETYPKNTTEGAKTSGYSQIIEKSNPALS